MTYEILARFAQTWGLLLFVGAFLAIVIYALLPSRRRQFDAAAHLPLQED